MMASRFAMPARGLTMRVNSQVCRLYQMRLLSNTFENIPENTFDTSAIPNASSSTPDKLEFHNLASRMAQRAKGIEDRLNPTEQPARRMRFESTHPGYFNDTPLLAERLEAESVVRPKIPDPIPIASTPLALLTLIGRDMKRYAEKFPTWESLFGASWVELVDLVPNARDRRYLDRWRQRFRQGRFGCAWEVQHLDDKGSALLGVYRRPNSDLGDGDGDGDGGGGGGGVRRGNRLVVNLPPGKTAHTIEPHEVLVVGAPYKYKRNKQPTGPHARSYKANKAIIDNWEGLWEDKRGRKIDGGERRRDEVRFKRAVAERKARREEMAAAAF